MQPMIRRLALLHLTLLVVTGTARSGQFYFEYNIVSDIPGLAPKTDPNLINPWGFGFSTTSPLWVSDQNANVGGSSVATVYTIHGVTTSGAVPALTVPVPNQGGAAPMPDVNGITGQVSTGLPTVTKATDFPVVGSKASFIFDNLDGSIAAWRGGLSPSKGVIVQTETGASFTGLAIANVSSGLGGGARIYAADQNSNNVFVYNSSWTKVGSLVDPTLPANFTAFNAQNIGGSIYVTYADPTNPLGLGGVVDIFSPDGGSPTRLITDVAGDHLQGPWGIALAPANWGQFGGDLLIGNNGGDGTINAYTTSGTWVGQLEIGDPDPFHYEELWALSFGNGGNFGSPNILYFDAGLTDAAHGLVGAVMLSPEPNSAIAAFLALGMLAGGWRWKHRRAAA